MINKREDSNNNVTVGVDSVSKAFAPRLVLDRISLDVAQGQSVCVCGVNGAGKSTLLRIIAGLLQPDRGSVRLCGHNLRTHAEEAKPQLGMISHKSMVYPDLTVLENLCFFANLYGVRAVRQSDGRTRADELLEDVGLSSYRYDRAAVLSRGLLQRLAIARALVHRPVVLLADEPFTGLDADACKHLIDVLANFAGDSGTTIMTTHDVNTGIKCCDRIVVLDRTRLIFDAMMCDIDTASFAQDYLSYARNKN